MDDTMDFLFSPVSTANAMPGHSTSNHSARDQYPIPNPSSASATNQQSAGPTTGQLRLCPTSASVPGARKATPRARIPQGVFERVQGKPPKRYISKEEKNRYRAFKQTLAVMELNYCDENNIRLSDFQRVTQSKVVKKGRALSTWDTFRTSKYFEELATNDGIDLPVGLIARQPIASDLWTRINATEGGRAECDEILALEQDSRDIAADNVPHSESSIAFTRPCTAVASDTAATQAYKQLASQCQEISAYYSLNYQIETFTVIGSSRVECKEDRTVVCSAGGEAFSKRMGWQGNDAELDILKCFTKVVTGHAALEEQVNGQNQLVGAGDVHDKKFTFRDLSIWYRQLVKQAFTGALRTQCAQGGVDMPSNPKFWFDRSKLLSQYKMTVHVSGGLRLGDFRSPTASPKMNLADLRRIIPLLRDNQLEFKTARVRVRSIARNPSGSIQSDDEGAEEAFL